MNTQTTTLNNTIKAVIGSWGSYTACNEKALGSKWLTLNDFDNWDEIKEELKNENFDLKGIDEELFIQDIEGLPSNCKNWDYTSPAILFRILKDAEVLNNEYKYKTMLAYLEVRDFSDFERLVEEKVDCWDDDIYFYENQTLLDVAYDLVDEYGYLNQMPENLRCYFDYQRFADDLEFDGFTEVKDGVIEISY